MSKIVPNKLSPLTYYLLEHYNDRLKCEVCNHTWSADGTAFSKDQAGTKNGMYYRYFRCKGKAKGKCSALYSHEDFLSLATRQLGSNLIGQAHQTLHLSSDEFKTKRPHDTSSTGYTPKHKRHSINLNKATSSPSFSSSSISINNHEASQWTNPSSSVDFRIDMLKDEIQFLKRQLEEKDSYITDLKDHIQLLKMSRNIPSTVKPFTSPSTVGQFSSPMTISQFSSPSILSRSTSPLPVNQSSSSASNPQSFLPTLSRSNASAAVKQTRSSPTVGRTSPPQRSVHSSPPTIHSPEVQCPSTPPFQTYSSSPVRIDEIVPQTPTSDLSIIYFLGLKCKKVGAFRKEAKGIGLDLAPIRNISFIGSHIAEVLVNSDVIQAFVLHAKSLGFSVDTQLDITKKDKTNPVWLIYGNGYDSMSDVIKSNFIRRVSHEIKSCQDLQVKQYYLEWTCSLGWTDSLLLVSTSVVSS